MSEGLELNQGTFKYQLNALPSELLSEKRDGDTTNHPSKNYPVKGKNNRVHPILTHGLGKTVSMWTRGKLNPSAKTFSINESTENSLRRS